MKTTNYLTLTIALFLLLVSMTACQTESKTAAANQVAAKPAQPEAAKMETAKSGTLASPTEAYKTAYAARQKKDAKGLQQALSKKMLSFMAAMAKDEQKTLDDEVKEMMAAPLAPTNEVRSEKITGDKATVEYQNDKGKWTVMDFVKEGSDWKLTMPSVQPTIIQNMPGKQ